MTAPNDQALVALLNALSNLCTISRDTVFWPRFEHGTRGLGVG